MYFFLLLCVILEYIYRATRIKTIIVKYSAILCEWSATYKQVTDSGLQSLSVHKWKCLDITFHTMINAQNPKDLLFQ